MVPRRAARATPGTAGATTTRRRAFPYGDLVAENGRRGKHDPEYELLDTGAFDDDRYWIVEVALRQGRPARPADVDPRHERRARRPTTLHVLPTAWFRNTWAWDVERRRSPSCALDGDGARRHRAPVPRRARAASSGRRAAERAVLRERDERRAALRLAPATAVPEGRDQRPRGLRRRDGDARRAGTKAAFWYRLTVEPGRDRRSAPAAAARRRRRGDPWRRLRRRRRRAPRRGRRVLRRADAGAARPPTRRWSCARPSPGCSGASSSTTTTSPAGSTATRPSRRRRRRGSTGATPRWRHVRRLRHHVDARQVGVPVVRRLGPRLPLRRARPRRPGVRQVPADPALPRVVPAPERGARPPTSGRSTT